MNRFCTLSVAGYRWLFLLGFTLFFLHGCHVAPPEPTGLVTKKAMVVSARVEALEKDKEALEKEKAI